MRITGNATSALGAGTRPGSEVMLPTADPVVSAEAREQARAAEAERLDRQRSRSPFAGRTFSSEVVRTPPPAPKQAPAPPPTSPAAPAKPVAAPRPPSARPTPVVVPEWPAEADAHLAGGVVDEPPVTQSVAVLRREAVETSTSRYGAGVDDEALAEAYGRLGTVAAAAAEIGINYERARRRLKARGVEPPRGPLPKRADVPPEELAAEYAAGSSIEEVARAHGCSRGTVMAAMHAAGVRRRERGASQIIDFDVEELRRLYADEGLSITAIAAQLDVHFATVARALKIAGIPRRRPGAPSPAWRRARAAAAAVAVETVEPVVVEARSGDLDHQDEQVAPGVDDGPFDRRACRECDCTQDLGCPEGCWWVEWDLCSRCDATGAGEPDQVPAQLEQMTVALAASGAPMGADVSRLMALADWVADLVARLGPGAEGQIEARLVWLIDRVLGAEGIFR